MAVITDLSWQQLLDKLPAGSLVVSNGKVMLDLSVAANINVASLTDNGVVKALTILLNAGAAAQTTANTGQATGEKLAAFGTVTNGTPTNGYVPVTRTFISRSELVTATNIIGQVA